MTVSFPLSLSEFWDQLPIAALTMDCAPQLESSGTAAGQQLVRELAPALWRGTVTLGKLTPDEAADAAGLIDLVRQPGASFLACDLTRPYPAYDPDGSVLDGATVLIQSIGASRRDLSLSGLPPYYQLRRGDLVGVSWGASPVRYGMHRVAVPSNADANGFTGMIEVAPALPAGVVMASPAVLARPFFKAMVTPNSVRPGARRSGLVEGASFDFIQTVR